MNWKAVVGVSMLCITMMIRCEEKKTHSSRSNETVKEKVEMQWPVENMTIICRIIYGEKGLSSLPIQDIAGEHIDTDNEYMYYYSVEFIK